MNCIIENQRHYTLAEVNKKALEIYRKLCINDTQYHVAIYFLENDSVQEIVRVLLQNQYATCDVKEMLLDADMLHYVTLSDNSTAYVLLLQN